MCQAELAECKTIIWNGPMGVFEMEKFAKVLTLLAVQVQKYKMYKHLKFIILF